MQQEATLGSLKILEFEGQTFERPLAIIYKANRILSPALKRFLVTLQEGKENALASGQIP